MGLPTRKTKETRRQAKEGNTQCNQAQQQPVASRDCINIIQIEYITITWLDFLDLTNYRVVKCTVCLPWTKLLFL